MSRRIRDDLEPERPDSSSVRVASVRSPSPRRQVSPAAAGYLVCVQTMSPTRAALERRRRRQELLDTLRQAAELRARLHPRANALARSRALLHARTTRG